MEAFEAVEQARAAKRKQDFPATELILRKALEVTTEPRAREELVRQLFYLYFSPVYEDLEQAQGCLVELDRLNPSAHNGMEWALFWMSCKQDLANAKKWFEITAARAESENSVSALYTATSFAGLLAAKESNLHDVQSALGKLRSFVESGQQVPWGDEVAFLEACVNLSDEIRRDAKALAGKTAPKIEDLEFRERAERVSQVG
jgi:hypothetical protein